MLPRRVVSHGFCLSFRRPLGGVLVLVASTCVRDRSQAVRGGGQAAPCTDLPPSCMSHCILQELHHKVLSEAEVRAQQGHCLLLKRGIVEAVLVVQGEVGKGAWGLLAFSAATYCGTERRRRSKTDPLGKCSSNQKWSGILTRQAKRSLKCKGLKEGSLRWMRGSALLP